eukprot:766393-Hanusia_phi.AAC.16
MKFDSLLPNILSPCCNLLLFRSLLLLTRQLASSLPLTTSSSGPTSPLVHGYRLTSRVVRAAAGPGVSHTDTAEPRGSHSDGRSEGNDSQSAPAAVRFTSNHSPWLTESPGSRSADHVCYASARKHSHNKF